jgi:hypothetical protein
MNPLTQPPIFFLSKKYNVFMLLKRHSGPNQVGDFSYEVTREFHGNVEMVGEAISVTGKTHGLDEQSLLDAEVGYFTMIDAVASEGIEGEKQAVDFMMQSQASMVSKI